MASRLTLGEAIAGAGFLEAIAMLLTPSAALVASIPLLVVTGVLSRIAYSVLSINQINLR